MAAGEQPLVTDRKWPIAGRAGRSIPDEFNVLVHTDGGVQKSAERHQFRSAKLGTAVGCVLKLSPQDADLLLVEGGVTPWIDEPKTGASWRRKLDELDLKRRAIVPSDGEPLIILNFDVYSHDRQPTPKATLANGWPAAASTARTGSATIPQMPTPDLFTSFSSNADRFFRRARWYLLGCVCAIAFTPAILGRFYPVFGPIPGRCLFVFMVGCLAVNAPLVLFGAPFNRGNASFVARAWLWFLAIVCDLWILACAAAIFNAFLRR